MIRPIAALAVLIYLWSPTHRAESKIAVYTPQKESKECIAQYKRTKKFYDDLMYKSKHKIAVKGLGEINVALVATVMTERICFTDYIGNEMVNMRQDLVPMRKAGAAFYRVK